MSRDAVAGDEECKILFPVGYNEAEQEIVEVKKKSKKNKGRKHVAPNEQGEVKEESEMSHEAVAENDLEDETLIGEEDNDEHDEEEDDIEDDEDNTLIGADKATSPIGSDTKSEL